MLNNISVWNASGRNIILYCIYIWNNVYISAYTIECHCITPILSIDTHRETDYKGYILELHYTSKDLQISDLR